MTIPDFSSLDLLLIKVSDTCNLHCSYCYQKDSLSKGYFTQWNELANAILSKKLPISQECIIKLTGGEPLCNMKNLQTGIKILYKKLVERNGYKIHFCLSTNGYFPNELNTLTSKKLIDSRYCWISWDGIHSSISRIPKSEFVKTPVSDAAVLKNLKKIKNKDLRVRIAITKENVSHIVDSVRWLYENRFKLCEYYFLYDYEDPSFFSNKEEFESIFRSLKEFQEKHYGVFTIMNFSSYPKQTTRIPCSHIGKMVYIDQYGDLYPCQMGSPDYPGYQNLPFSCLLGNIEQGLNKEKISTFLQNWETYMTVPKTCNQCQNMQCYHCPIYSFGKSFVNDSYCSIRSLEYQIGC